MADTTVDSAAEGELDQKRGLWGPYWSDKDTGVIIFIDDGTDLHFRRTTDAGAGWSSETTIKAGSIMGFAAYADMEVPGDSGTLIHIAYLDDTATDTVYYRSLDVSDGTLGTEQTITTATIDATPSFNRIAITKAVNGNLLVVFSTQTEGPCYRSTDSGANWTSRTDPIENPASEDFITLYPADVDDGDCVILFGDRGAEEMSIKMYDDSANTWTETSVGTFEQNFDEHYFDAAIRLSDKHLLVALWNIADLSTSDLNTYDITVDSIASPTVTAKTDVVTNQDESAYCGMIINQQNDDVYVAYAKGGTLNSSTDVVFHKSDDDMATWETESAYSEDTADDIRLIHGGRSVTSLGGRIQFSWFNDDLNDIFVNLTNDIEITASAVAVVCTRTLMGVGCLMYPIANWRKIVPRRNILAWLGASLFTLFWPFQDKDKGDL